MDQSNPKVDFKFFLVYNKNQIVNLRNEARLFYVEDKNKICAKSYW